MEITTRFFVAYSSESDAWFRFRRGRSYEGIGLCFSRSSLLFSEHHGYTKYWKLPFGWRVNILNRYKD